MRKILLLSGLFLLLVSAFLGWRHAHPRLSDQEQIAAALDGIAAAADARQPRGIVGFLAPDFKFEGGTRKDLQTSLAGGLLQYRVVDLNLSGAQVKVQGDSATSAGRYRLSLKSEFDSPAEITTGQFTLKWRKENGQWLVTQAEAPPL